MPSGARDPKFRPSGRVNRRARSRIYLDEMDFEIVFPALFVRAWRLAYRILGDRAAAEDVAAEALLRTWTNWEHVGGLDYREAWVLRVATNLALEQVRRQSVAMGGTEPADDSDVVVLRLALVEALSALPTRQRQAIVLRYFADLSAMDVARLLGISAGSAKTHIHRGLAALRLKFADDFDAHPRKIQEETMRIRSLRDARRAMEEGWILTGRVVDRVSSSRRPGWDWLHVDIGMSAMLLSRHAGLSPGEDYGWLIGHEVDVKVIEVDDEEGCVYVSRRAVLENEHLVELRRAMLEALVGQTRLGRVTLVLPFGAFVDLGGVFGLLPVSEFARPGESREELKSRNQPTSDGQVVRGQGIRVEIVSADLDRGRATLRLPQGTTG